MKEIKGQIITEEGLPVQIKDSNGTILYSTNALVGKATKQFFSEISLEYHREGQFISDVVVNNGNLVTNLVTNEDYLVLATMEEIVQEEKIATVARMIKCNAAISIKKYEETADEFGNIVKQQVTVADNLSVYMVKVSNSLDQYKMGLVANAEYLIYSPLINVSVLNKLLININGEIMQFKVESVDYISFNGVVLIGIVTDQVRS